MPEYMSENQHHTAARGFDGQGKSETANREEEVLAFWKKHGIFEKSLKKEAPNGEFVFYDGPPFATGLPHVGNLLSFIIKDIVPRYKTMRGHRVPRRWGWDCHGLPIESLIEKRLQLKTKKDIEKIGVGTFNREARKSVLEFTDEWERYVDRVGRWIDFKNSYRTMDASYVESVWWALKELHTKGLLYEGRKVLMYCPHCETPLAKAEIAMDHTYQDLTEEAVTVKFKVRNPEKLGYPKDAAIFLLAWTTTPWTLPGNVALAIGKDIRYVMWTDARAGVGTEGYIMAASRFNALGIQSVAVEIPAGQLLSLEYEPLYSIPAVEAHKGKKHIVLAADFVSTEEGTGIVHTAVMYGEDDYQLGGRENLPMVQLLNANGTYNDQAPEFIRGKYIKDAEGEIKADLEKRGLLFAREMNTHPYPHCYRCGTPLIYNAVSSWFINIQKVKSKMLSENEKVTWVPEHLKEGRFKNIVESAPDWTISRNRYWASPLPIWKGKSGKLRVIGSVAELLSLVRPSGNRYFLMRHGEARSNVEQFLDSDNSIENHLTEKGRAAVHTAARELAAQGIDMIIVSPLVRTQETARIVAEHLKLPESAIMTDERLRERWVGSFNGKHRQAFFDSFHSIEEEFLSTPGGSESLYEVRRRMGAFLFEIEKKYSGRGILIVTHGDPAWMLLSVARRMGNEELMRLVKPEGNIEGTQYLPGYLEKASWTELSFVSYPHNEEYELDLHRPYIDELTVRDKSGEELQRIPEVVDCWVESGSMPFAAEHYLGAPLPHFNPRAGLFARRKRFPGDFIAEYIAQTRTWFYYMHAMGVLLFGSRAFRTVVSTGTILAADGSKMSKSKGNYTDPLLIMNRFGADALRLYLLGSVVMRSEDLNFKDDEVRETHNRVVGILWNSYKFFDLYRDSLDRSVEGRRSTHVLDRWMFARLDETTRGMTETLDAYDMPRSSRHLRSFIDDYSTWYVRRSRERVKGGAVKGDVKSDARFAIAGEREALETLARLAAPLMPFIAEMIYRGVGGAHESVHLTDWPDAPLPDAAVIEDMKAARQVATLALEARNAAGLKVRQPLSRLAIGISLAPEYLALIKDEVNVKTITVDPSLQNAVSLDTALSPELVEEGNVRELIRAIQDARKKAGLTPADRPSLTVSGDGTDFVFAHKDELIKAASLADIARGEGGETVELSHISVRFALLTPNA